MAIAGMATAGMMVSCNETYAEQDKGATPVIKYARTCNINEADSLVASASLGAHLCRSAGRQRYQDRQLITPTTKTDIINEK